MKLIVLKFLTKKGEEAYFKVESEGKKQSWKDKQIASHVAKDVVFSKSPLEVHVEVKIEWLAVQVQLDQQIIIGLKKHGAVIEKDYTLEVR
jgi:hypothetical protein